MNDSWPWLTLVGLGVFHGLNPAMGWLFAVGLGLQRQSGRIVMQALLPIAIGHLLAIGVALGFMLALGAVLDLTWLRQLTGVFLMAWAVWHWRYGHRHRVRVGMQTGLVGLTLWSFLMASAHGAGLMLLPVLLPLSMNHEHMHGFVADTLVTAGLAVLLHSLATLVTTAVIATIVYQWLGLAILRTHWINFDMLWTVMLVVAGLLMLW